VLNQPFFQVALPIMATFIATVWIASWSQNKRLDEMSRRFDDALADVKRRLDAIEADLKEFYRTLTDLDKRISRLEPGA
jgi:hypothetical protein